MPASGGQNDLWRKSIKLLGRCPVCGSDYREEETRIFENRRDARVVHITCVSCRSYFIAAVVAMEKGVGTIGIVTDLSFGDMGRLGRKAPVSIDEVIEGHALLADENFVKFFYN